MASDMTTTKSEEMDLNPTMTGFLGALFGALLGGVVGVLFADRRFRSAAKDQFQRYRKDGMEFFEYMKHKSEETPGNKNRLIAHAD